MSSVTTNDSANATPLQVGVMGAGAVGLFFAAKLARAGHPVTVVARPAHVAAIARDGLRVQSSVDGASTVPLTAVTAAEALAPCDVVLVCVKTVDTDAVGDALARVLRPDALVVSLQNGVDNAGRIRDAAGIDALAAVVYVAASMPGPGHLLHAGRGDLILGEYGPALSGRPRAAGRDRRIAALFESAGVPCPVSVDVRVELWEKLVVNCAFNAISALTRQRYGRMVADAGIRDLMRQIIDECVAVAAADGVALADAERQFDAALQIGEAMARATSSTAQDMARGRKTEIDSLNGHVARRGAALGVPTPANQALHALIRLAESAPG